MTEKLTKQQNDIFRIIEKVYPDKEIETFRNLAKDRKSTRLNSSHVSESRMPSSA